MSRFKRTAEHIRIERVKSGLFTRFYVFDLSSGKEIRELSEYSRIMETLNVLTIEKSLYHVVRIYEFCRAHGMRLEFINNDVLKKYRDWELARTKSDKSYRGHVATAKNTVNSKLDSILHWLAWMNETGRMSVSGVTFHSSVMSTGRVKNRRPASGVFFGGTGAKSRHKVTVVPSNLKRAEIDALILSTPISQYAAHRNILMAKLVAQAGFRIGSLTSLLVSQFSAAEIEESDDDNWVVVPSAQKFDRANEYSVPISLAFEVVRFIEDYRNPLVNSKNGGRDLTDDHLFVSATTAKPMTARAFSKLYGQIMKHAGLKKGNAIHILRKVFGTDAAEAEIQLRLKTGMDVSTDAVKASLALRLNQSNPDSTRPYVLRSGDVVMAKVVKAEEEEAKRLRAKLIEANEEISRLKKTLEESAAGLLSHHKDSGK